MKKFLWVSFVFMILVISVKSQSYVTMIDIENIAVKSNRDYKQLQSLGHRVEGSMYLNEAFSPGLLVMKATDNVVSNLQFRYNIYMKQMEFIHNGDTLALTKPEKVKYIVFQDQTFAYLQYLKGERIENDYFQILVDGKFQLLHHYKVHFEPRNPPATPYNAGNPNDKYSRLDDFYVQREGELATIVSLNKKSLLAFMKDKEPQIMQFIKKNKLKIRKPEDAVRLITFYNSLL